MDSFKVQQQVEEYMKSLIILCWWLVSVKITILILVRLARGWKVGNGMTKAKERKSRSETEDFVLWNVSYLSLTHIFSQLSETMVYNSNPKSVTSLIKNERISCNEMSKMKKKKIEECLHFTLAMGIISCLSNITRSSPIQFNCKQTLTATEQITQAEWENCLDRSSSCESTLFFLKR